MTPDQAVAILDQAASLAALNRADHQRVVEAVRVLLDLIRQEGHPDAPQR